MDESVQIVVIPVPDNPTCMDTDKSDPIVNNNTSDHSVKNDGNTRGNESDIGCFYESLYLFLFYCINFWKEYAQVPTYCVIVIVLFLCAISYPGKLVLEYTNDSESQTWEPWPNTIGQVFWSMIIYVVCILIALILGLVFRCCK